jgi:hypothetical protein
MASPGGPTARAEFGPEDRLVIILGDPDGVARALRDLCERARSAPDQLEWRRRLAGDHRRVLSAIERTLSPGVDVLELLRRTTVEIAPLEEIEHGFERRRLGVAFALPARFLAVLRDIAGGGARRRALFLAAPLRTRLATEFGIDVVEPAEWGLPAYRSTVERLARIEVPGTGISGSSRELFVWPRARDYDRAQSSDFEDDEPGWDVETDKSNVDLQQFPSNDLGARPDYPRGRGNRLKVMPADSFVAPKTNTGFNTYASEAVSLFRRRGNPPVSLLKRPSAAFPDSSSGPA